MSSAICSTRCNRCEGESSSTVLALPASPLAFFMAVPSNMHVLPDVIYRYYISKLRHFHPHTEGHHFGPDDFPSRLSADAAAGLAAPAGSSTTMFLIMKGSINTENSTGPPMIETIFHVTQTAVVWVRQTASLHAAIAR